MMIAVEMARAAEAAGAMAVLLLPPYLITPDQAGLAAYVEAICRSVGVGVIVYSRDNGVFTLETMLRLANSCPNMIGLKDGTGDFETLSSMKRELGERLVFINGAPTAEILARQCFAIGVRAYSSAVFAFLPSLANRFFNSLRDGDAAQAEKLINSFYLPLAKLRNRRRGYAVAIVKAGLRVVGRSAGPVRPPLVDLEAPELEELRRLIALASDSANQEARR
jgi:5-dehydro-4-deoxyglucarate dehydratase